MGSNVVTGVASVIFLSVGFSGIKKKATLPEKNGLGHSGEECKESLSFFVHIQRKTMSQPGMQGEWLAFFVHI